MTGNVFVCILCLAHNECVLFASRDVKNVACDEANSFSKVISVFSLDVFIGM